MVSVAPLHMYELHSPDCRTGRINHCLQYGECKPEPLRSSNATSLLTVIQLMKYMDLDQKGYSMAEYIWVDGNNGVRSKTKVRAILPPVV